MATNNTYKVITPHAAIIIWNYNDRLGVNDTDAGTLNDVDETIVSTISCTSIHTSKSKGSPEGSFQVTLAPTKNWVSEITSGSWCVILMSNSPITEYQLKHADPNFVKMIGKIEHTTCEVHVNEEGARQTRYTISGTDWGHIFNNVMYIDNLISSPGEPPNQGNAIAQAWQNQFLSDGNKPLIKKTTDNLVDILSVFGSPAAGLTGIGKEIHRLAKAIYDFNIPFEMAQYFSFINANEVIDPSTTLSDLLVLQVGKLIADNTYEETDEAYGFIDPFSIREISPSGRYLQIIVTLY